MCLTVSGFDTRLFHQTYFNKEPDTKITVYKILYKSPTGNIFTPWRMVEVKLNSELVAFNPHDKGYSTPVKNHDEIGGGVIHCWRSLEDAINDVSNEREIVVECIAKIKDFVAIGSHNDICFTQIFISDKIVYEQTADLVIKQEEFNDASN